MKNQKYSFLLIILMFISPLVSCNKYQKGDTTLKVKIINGVTNEPFVNVGIRIDEEKYINNEIINPEGFVDFSKHIWEGKTDAQGRLTYRFNAIKNSKYSYVFNLTSGISFYDSNFEAETYAFYDGTYDRNLEKGVVNNREIKLVKIIDYQWDIKNVNCVDENDEIAIRYKGLYHDWQKFAYLPNEGRGCIDFGFVVTRQLQDILIVEKTVTKNDLTIVSLDTITVINTNGVDTIQVYY